MVSVFACVHVHVGRANSIVVMCKKDRNFDGLLLKLVFYKFFFMNPSEIYAFFLGWFEIILNFRTNITSMFRCIIFYDGTCTFTQHNSNCYLYIRSEIFEFLWLWTCFLWYYSSASNRIIHAKDHASVQINVAEVDPNTGIMTGASKTYAICGAIRMMGESDDCIARLAKRDNLLTK